MDKLQQLLNDEMQFPCPYTFKFIVPNKDVCTQQVEDLLQGCELTKKSSSNQKYLSFTAQKTVESSEDVIRIYNKASQIEGIISL